VTFQIAGTIESFNATHFTLQLARATGVAASAIALNIVSGSLTVTASFYISSASDRSRVVNTLDQPPSALSATLGATVLSTPTIRLVEPAPPPNMGNSAAALPASESASSSSLLMIAWIMAGAFAAACACTLLVLLYMIRRRNQRQSAAIRGAFGTGNQRQSAAIRGKQLAELRRGERRPRKKRDVDSGVEMTEHGETACREVVRDHLERWHASLPVGSATLAARPSSSAAHATLQAARLTAVATPITHHPAGRCLACWDSLAAQSALPDDCFEVRGTITEQMTQGVQNQVLSQLPEGVQFDDFYPEAVLSYARARRRLRALRILAKRAGSGTEDAGDDTASPLQRI